MYLACGKTSKAGRLRDIQHFKSVPRKELLAHKDTNRAAHKHGFVDQYGSVQYPGTPFNFTHFNPSAMNQAVS